MVDVVKVRAVEPLGTVFHQRYDFALEPTVKTPIQSRLADDTPLGKVRVPEMLLPADTEYEDIENT